MTNTLNIRPGDLSAHGDAIHYLAGEYDKPVSAARQAAEAATTDAFELSPIARSALTLVLQGAPKATADAVSLTQLGVRRYAIAAKAVSKGLSAEDENASAVIAGSLAHSVLPFGTSGSLSAERTGAQLGLDSKVPTDLTVEVDYGHLLSQDDAKRIGPDWMDKVIDLLPGDYMPGVRKNGSWLNGSGIVETIATALGTAQDPSVVGLLTDMGDVASDIKGAFDSPVNTVLTAAIGWIYEHIEPLPSQLDMVAGSGMVWEAHAKTWKNIGWSVWTLGEQVETRLTTDLRGQQSEAVQAYFRSFGSGRQAIARLGENCNQMAGVMSDCALLTDALRDFVRGVLTQVIADIIQYFLRIKGFMKFPGVGGNEDAMVRSYARQLAGNYGMLIEKFIRRAVVVYKQLAGKLETVRAETQEITRLWQQASPQLA
ncbi:hypothetical protein LX16_2685 [Stackebrandtia albiflava]|uniref:Excreted virulence factor EspC (Type VII ESX diderm) n=1 Tax=Stackebrandtia albiflava TaxID=406432 RepID=A0A562V293_9ACTN|nr:hypothetical protein [Stackebrandtia albiflava]TWJ11942.1 hypothetical protein LX16_2685 [Stackebrandtia albiflava]